MKTIFLTTLINRSESYNNLIWDSYYQSKNCQSINYYINKNSKIYKKKTSDQLDKISNKILSNIFLNKFYRINKNFNFFDTTLLNEKSFYKDKFGSLNKLIKCIALCDLIKKDKIKKIIFNINDYDVLIFLKDFCKLNKILIQFNKKNFINFYLDKLKGLPFLLIGLVNFLRFLFKRIRLPKTNENHFKNSDKVFIDYLAYFDQQKFRKGKYVSQFWGGLFKKIKKKDTSLFLHIFDPQCSLSNKELSESLLNLNSNKSEKHMILDSFLSFNILNQILKKWFFFLINKRKFEREIDHLFLHEDLKFYHLFKKNILEYLIGFNGLINLYFYYLFQNFFSKLNKNQKEKNFFYLCENQGWEKSFLHFANLLFKKKKIYPVIYTPIRFWDLRFYFSKYERKSFFDKIEKICVMSIYSKYQLKKNFVPLDKIKIVEALRYENLVKFRSKKNILKFKNNILIMGDVHKNSNIQLENYFLKFSKFSKLYNLIAKPHPNRNFSPRFMCNNINISYENTYSLASKTNTAVCSNMTAASYDLNFLGLNTLIFLSGDGIDFSPVKNILDSNYLYDFDILEKKIEKKNKKNKLNQFKKKAFCFDKNYKSWKKIFYV